METNFISNHIFYFVLWLKLNFNPVLKRLTEKCTIMITKMNKKGFHFLVFHCMSFILSISPSEFLQTVSPNLNVLKSFNYQKLNLLKPKRACLFIFFYLVCFVLFCFLVCNDLALNVFWFFFLELSYSN